MESENEDLVSPLFTLLKYKQLAEDPGNHSLMIKDKTTITFLAYTLDSSDEELLKASLTTLELLSQNPANRITIKSTFGVIEALKCLINNENIVNSSLRSKAEKIIDLLNTPVLPDKKAIEKGATAKIQKSKKIVTFQVLGLHLETQKELEDILMKKCKGVVTVMVDVEHQRCVATVYDHVDPKVLASTIAENTPMEAQLVTKNKFNQEVLVPLTDNTKTLDLSDLPPYLDEKDSPVKDKAVKSTKDFRITASQWFSSAAGFLQKSFYW